MTIKIDTGPYVKEHKAEPEGKGGGAWVFESKSGILYTVEGDYRESVATLPAGEYTLHPHPEIPNE